MDYTIYEKVTITAWAISLETSIEECRLKFFHQFNKQAPPRKTISYWREKLLETGSLVTDRPRSGRPSTATGDNSEAIVLESVAEDPTTSTRRLSDEVNVSQSSVCRILKNNNFHPYKPLYSQFICDGDSDRRAQFCEQMLSKFTRDPAFVRKITFSDECVFNLAGNVNKHNVHYWAHENPLKRICNPGKTASLTVWACISFNGVIAVDISNQTMNGERYCSILNEKVVPFFIRKREMLYQHDGAPAHYHRNAREILDTAMPNQWIGRRGPIEWPARSPDLSACDYWLWSYLRLKVYTDGVTFRSIRDLKEKITTEIENIPRDMFRRSFRDFEKRCHACLDSDGGLFES